MRSSIGFGGGALRDFWFVAWFPGRFSRYFLATKSFRRERPDT
jgi:hypothetical protein